MKKFILSIDSCNLTKESTSKNGSIYSIFCRVYVDEIEVDKISLYCPIVDNSYLQENIDAFLTHKNYFEMLKDFIRFYNKHILYIGKIEFEFENDLGNVFDKQIWADAYDLGLFKGDKYHRVNLYGFSVPERFTEPNEFVKWFKTITNK